MRRTTRALELLGSYLAIAIQNMLFRERSEATEPEPAAASTEPMASGGPRLGCHDILFYGQEEVIMADGEYLVRGLPARIFWKLLRLRNEQGRTEFTNRELRLDKTLNLAEWRDNLETRLLLLRRRLDQKCKDIRIVPRARGRFALELGCQVTLADRP